MVNYQIRPLRFDVLLLIINSAAGKYEAGQLVINIIVLLYRLYMAYCVYCLIQEFKAQQRTLAFHASMEAGIVYGNPARQPVTPVINVVAGDGYTYSINQQAERQGQHQGHATAGLYVNDISN